MRVNVFSQGQVAQLAESFNQLASQLELAHNEGKQKAHAQIAAQSITDAKKYIENIIQSLSEMLFVTDQSGLVQTINKKVTQVLGFEKDELLGCELIKLIQISEESNLKKNIERERFIDHLRNDSSGSIHELEVSCLSKSNEWIPALLSGSSLFDRVGKVQGFIFSMADARESRLLRDLRETQAQLVQSAKLASLGEMSAGVAHELNNPLMFILGAGNRIKAALKRKCEVNENDIGDYLGMISDGVQRMKKIIQNFRDFSRQSSNEMREINVNMVVERALMLFQEQLRLLEVEIKTDYSSEDLLIKGNFGRLEQVVVNLISNARDSVVEKGALDKCIFLRTKSNGEEICIEVEDNGGGIDDALLNRVFDPFFTTKKVGQGTGLGLSLSHGIINDHSGTICVESTPHGGALFVIALPVLGAQEKDQLKKASAA